MIAFFDDAGFILGGWVITFAVIGGFAWRVVSSGKRLGKQVPDDEKYWT
jgi:hypothetical protein